MSHNIYRTRREQLVELVKKQHPNVNKGAILLIAGFENERNAFRQESSFYYTTGITESGIILLIDLEGKTTLFIPRFENDRSKWLLSALSATPEAAKDCFVDSIEYLGEPVPGYTMPLLAKQEAYSSLIIELGKIIEQGGKIFSLSGQRATAYVEQKIILARLLSYLPPMQDALLDIAPILATMRRKKSKREIELIYKAMELTIVAHQGAACTIEPGKKEYEISSGIEYIFQESGAKPAFPSIVAAGKNSVVLHALPTANELKKNDLVVIDIGAERDYYCADISRTYPVSGTFTKRQKEVYAIVLAVQEYIAQLAVPGMWLNNPEVPERSLHHKAVAFLEKKGYAKYFNHGIGHYLGLDVHDVGSYTDPLEEGDVITIEPGLYIPEEGFGIRIEDNYWLVKDGTICLSEDLPKDIDSIESMAQDDLDFDDSEEDDAYDS